MHAFSTLKEAVKEIAKINVNPTGVKIMALKAIQASVRFKRVDSRTANIAKQEMLSRGGDVAVSRDVGSFEAEKTDMIIIGSLAQHVRLAKKLKYQTAFDCREIARDIQSLLLDEFGIAIESSCLVIGLAHLGRFVFFITLSNNSQHF